jgi:hypothetical protein
MRGTERRTVPQCAELVESSCRFRWPAFTGNRLLPVIRLRRSLLLAAGKFRIMQPGRDAGEDRSMPREGYFILDSDQ